MERASRQKALILKGARQVGKTWLMKEFGKRYFDHVAYVNLDRNNRMRRVFDGDFDVESIVMSLHRDDQSRKMLGKL